MSQENVEVVRRIYEDGLYDQHPEELLALVDAEIEFVTPPRPSSQEFAAAPRRWPRPFRTSPVVRLLPPRAA
jgi:hypothetical protein